MNRTTDFDRADTSNLPKVDTLMLMEFMNSSDKYNVAEIRGAKALMSSRQSYIESAVGYVEVKRTGSLCDVRAKIVPEHKINNKYYIVTVHLNELKDVITDTSCDGCAAAAGGCKHTLVFLYWLQKRSAEPSPTSVECYWVKPNLKRAREEVLSIKNLIKNKVPQKGPKDASILEKFRNEAYKHACRNSLIISYDQNKQTEKLTNYCIFNMMVNFVQQETDHSYKNYKIFIDRTVCGKENKISQATIKQADSKLWHCMRQGRITGSKLKIVRGRSVNKKMIAVFFRRGGPVAVVPLEDRRTVTSQWYTEVCLPQAFDRLGEDHPKSGTHGIIFHQDNAPAHTAAITIHFLTSKGVQLVSHPPYSPDLA